MVKLKMLKVKKENFIGIRDLSTASILQRKDYKWKKENIAERVLRTLYWQRFKWQKGKIVREVYNVLRHDWIDTFDLKGERISEKRQHSYGQSRIFYTNN